MSATPSAPVSSFTSASPLFTNARSAPRSRPSSGRRRAGRRRYAVMLAAAAVPVVARVQQASADISGFGDATPATGWQLNGTAVAVPPSSGTTVTEIQLTDANNSEAASVFYNVAQRVNNFTAEFHYTFLNGSGNPADGVALVVQNDAAGSNALGGGGGSLGYTGITNSAAFEINIYQPNVRGIAYHSNGDTGGYQPAGAIDFTNTNGVDITLQYNGTFLKETLTQGTNTYSNQIAADIVGAVGGTSALVGFTGATGGENSNQHVSNFSFVTGTNAAGPGPGLPYHWIGSNGNWTNTLGWLPVGYPGSNAAVLDDAFIDQVTGGNTVHLTTALPGTIGTLAVSNGNTLSVESGGSVTTIGTHGLEFATNGGSANLIMNGNGVLNAIAGRSTFGSNGGNATINISGSATLGVTGLILGTGGGAGTMTLSGGQIKVGGGGHASDQGGGDNLIGDGTGSTATVTQTGGAINSTGAWIRVGNNGATGTYNMSGGSINVDTRMYVGWGPGSVGTLNISGGTITTGAEFDTGIQTNNGPVSGPAPIGVVNQTGGTVNVTRGPSGANAWHIVGQQGGNGTYNMSGNATLTCLDGAWIGIDAGSMGVLHMSGNAVYNSSPGGANATSIGRGGGNGTLELADNAIFNAFVDSSVGRDTGSVGQFTQTGGTFNQTNITNIGRNGGNGTYDFSGGVLHIFRAGTTSRLAVGRDAGAIGTINISGTAQAIIDGNVVLSENTGQGTINQSGGSIQLIGGTNNGTIIVGGTDNSSGGTEAVYNMSGGTISIAGGLATNGISIAPVDGANGTFNLNGTSGASVVNSPTLLIGAGAASVATYAQTGGTFNITSNGTAASAVTVGRSDSNTLSSFTVSGGTFNGSNANALFTVNPGGTAIVGGGTALATVTIGQINADNLTVTNRGLVKMAVLATPHSQTNAIGALTISGDGVLDLGNQQVLLDNTRTSDAQVHQYLSNAYNRDVNGIGNWLGKGGITSSDAIKSHNGSGTNAPDFRISVGYVNGAYATDPLINGPLPGQENLPTNRILVRPALYGDFNLDGKVDDTDLQIFSGLGQYNKPTDKFGWFGGDLNHDGKVDDTDLQIFSGAGNYNGPTYGAAGGASHASATPSATPSLTGHVEANGDIILSAATTQGVAGDGVLDFVYNPSNGHLTLSYDGDPRVTSAQPFQVVRFKSAGSHFIPANFNGAAFGAGVTATTAALNGTASGSNSVPDGYDMGAVLPTGLAVSDLTSDLTLQWNVFGGGLTLKNGDVIVPEPAAIGLLGIGAVGLLTRRRKQRVR